MKPPTREKRQIIQTGRCFHRKQELAQLVRCSRVNTFGVVIFIKLAQIFVTDAFNVHAKTPTMYCVRYVRTTQVLRFRKRVIVAIPSQIRLAVVKTCPDRDAVFVDIARARDFQAP